MCQYSQAQKYPRGQKCANTNPRGECANTPQLYTTANVIFIFHFGLLFALLPPPKAKKSKLKKNEKNT